MDIMRITGSKLVTALFCMTVFLAVTAVPRNAIAAECQCMQPSDHFSTGIYNKAAMVIRGKVLEADDGEVQNGLGYTGVAKVDILESYKGRYDGEVSVMYRPNRNECGFGSMRRGQIHDLIIFESNGNKVVAQGVCPMFTQAYWKDLKVKSARLANEDARGRQACLQEGGKWEAYGTPPTPFCNFKTTDSGAACSDDGDCEGECIAKLSSGQVDMLMKAGGDANLPASGRCSQWSTVLGCWPRVEGGMVDSLLCL